MILGFIKMKNKYKIGVAALAISALAATVFPSNEPSDTEGENCHWHVNKEGPYKECLDQQDNFTTESNYPVAE